LVFDGGTPVTKKEFLDKLSICIPHKKVAEKPVERLITVSSGSGLAIRKEITGNDTNLMSRY